MERKNRGFTLIELIVTIAIMGIFSGVVLTVIGTGANSSRSTSSNAKAQMETQEVMDQIQNMIIDVNRSVYYAYGEGINQKIGSEIRNDIDSTDNSQSKTFFACSATELNAQQKKYAYSCDVIEWDSSDQKLYYACRTWEGEETETTQNDTKNEDELASYSADGELTDGGTDTSDGNGDTNIKSKRTSEIVTKVSKTLLADNITNFCVDVSKAESERIVRFQFTTDKNGKEITTIHTVNLRNQVQVGEPGEGYGTSDSDKPWIKITNYPSEIKPGETLSGFSKLMNGNIDPSTVKWVVDSNNGTIIGQEDSAVSLTADQNASGEISVYVQAQTTDGKTVVSQIVKISVKEKEAKELITDTKELLLGVGNSYALSGIVKWRIEYNDGTKSNPVSATNIQWSTTSSLVTLGSDGNIQVPPNFGKTKSDSTFEITVSYEDTKTKKTLTNTLPVKLARLDLVQPTGTFHVGDTMPFEYVYKEGGESKTLSDAQIVKSAQHKKSMTASGTFGQAFTADDVGDWTATAEVDLSKCSGYGKLKAESSFKVEAAVINQEIKISEGNVADTIVAGQDYHCSYYNAAHFYFPMSFKGNWQYKIVWKISNYTDTDKDETPSEATGFGDKDKREDNAVVEGVADGNNNNKDAILYVGKNEHGFTLSADMEIYDTTTTQREVKYHYFGQLNVKVITNVQIISPSTTVVKGHTYPFTAHMVVWHIDENGGHSSEFLTEKDNYIYWNIVSTSNKGEHEWKIPQDQKDADLVVGIKNPIPDILNPTSKTLEIPQHITVEESPYTIELKDESGNTKTEIYPDDIVQLVATMTLNGKNYTPDNITWECRRKTNNEKVNPILIDKGTDGKKKEANMSKIGPGEYEIRVSYWLNNQERKSNPYTIKVKKYTTIANIVAVDNKTTIKEGESTKIYLNLENEKGKTTGRVNWSCNGGAITYPSTWYQGNVLSDGAITITAKDEEYNKLEKPRTDTWTAAYTLGDGETGTTSIDITIIPK